MYVQLQKLPHVVELRTNHFSSDVILRLINVKLRKITSENDLTKYDQNETKTDELAT